MTNQELDDKMAEVMNLTIQERCRYTYGSTPDHTEIERLGFMDYYEPNGGRKICSVSFWHPTTDIAQAERVLEAVRGKPRTFHIRVIDSLWYQAAGFKAATASGSEVLEWFFFHADTPLAICRSVAEAMNE
jgi:hypothetical protein